MITRCVWAIGYSGCRHGVISCLLILARLRNSHIVAVGVMVEIALSSIGARNHECSIRELIEKLAASLSEHGGHVGVVHCYGCIASLPRAH